MIVVGKEKTNKDFIEFISKIEKEFPVDKIEYNGINVWPVLRLTLHGFFINSSNNEKIKSAQKRRLALRDSTIEVNLISRIIRKIHFFFSRIKQVIIFISLFSREKNKAFFFGLGSQKAHRNYIFEGKRFHRFGDSLKKFVGADKIQLMEFVEGIECKHNYGDVIYLDGAYYFLFSIYSHIQNLFKKEEERISDSFYSFNDYLTTTNFIGKKELLAESSLIACRKFYSKYRFFTLLFEWIKPKALFFICFYSYDCFAISLAACERKIPSVDIQHGQQGDYHHMYTHWENMPKKGYKIMPEYFWMWGRSSKERLDKWVEHQNYHQTIIGGNPWLAFRKISIDSELRKEKEISFFNKSKGIKNVLISLQYTEDIPSFLMKAIKDSSEIKWCFRLHPRFIHELNVLEGILKKYQIDKTKYEIEYSTKLDYYELIKHMDFQITFWSTVAYEALVFGVPTIIIHPNGKEAMQEAIEDGVFYYTQNSEQILQIIKNKLIMKSDNKYIEFNNVNIRNKFNAITEI